MEEWHIPARPSLCFVARSGSTVYKRCSLAAVYTAQTYSCVQIFKHISSLRYPTVGCLNSKMWLHFLASDSCTAVGQLSEADNCRQDRPMSTASRCRSFRPMSVVEAYSTHSTHCCSTICTSCTREYATPPYVHLCHLHVTSFTRPSPR